MGIKRCKPLLYRVLVKPDPVEEVSEGGIVIQYESKKREDEAQIIGTVVEIGQTCWSDIKGDPGIVPGDRVLFPQHAGARITVGDELHRILNDEDILGLVEEEGHE